MPTAAELPPSLRELARKHAMPLRPVGSDTDRLISILETALAREGEADAPKRDPEPPRSRISRILRAGTQAALTYAGEEKAFVLAEMLSAAVVAAPDRVEWLADTAEAAARSIEFTSTRRRRWPR
jgi:hypothetical protein